MLLAARDRDAAAIIAGGRLAAQVWQVGHRRTARLHRHRQ